MNEKENAIIAENIVKKFGSLEALKGIDLLLNSGVLLAFLIAALVFATSMFEKQE